MPGPASPAAQDTATTPPPLTKARPLAAPARASEPLQLAILSEVGPWPVASRLIGYQGKLWFANSVKGRNHNSADIWSYNPATKQTRYERHLFSQDAGVPLVYKGLLYWPFEDALMSAGNGVIEATNGTDWQSHLIPGNPIYHTSQVMAWQDGLLALTGARSTQLYHSSDDGQSWQTFYAHPFPDKKIARLKELTAFQDTIYASLRDDIPLRLARWDGKRFVTADGWPNDRYFNGLTVHKDQLYGLVGRGAARQIWRYDGQQAERVGPAGRFVDLASDGRRLWVIVRSGASSGQLWASSDGEKWERHDDLQGGRPISVEAVSGNIYVGGTSDKKRGIIWGVADHAIAQDTPPPMAKAFPAPTSDTDWKLEGERLDRLLRNAGSYYGLGRGQLRQTIMRAVSNGAPRGFFAKRLAAQIPNTNVQAFGGSIKLTAQDVAATLLFRAMELSGHADVPVQYLTQRWTREANSYEKYFEPQLAALQAVAVSGQNDRATVAALMQRLDTPDDPLWLRGLVVGALTSATGQRHGYDIAAWKAWFARQ